jgi:hypothetical protein
MKIMAIIQHNAHEMIEMALKSTNKKSEDSKLGKKAYILSWLICLHLHHIVIRFTLLTTYGIYRRNALMGWNTNGRKSNTGNV